MYTTKTTPLKNALASLLGVNHESLDSTNYNTREYYEGCQGYTWKSPLLRVWVERMRFECDNGGEDTVYFNWEVRPPGGPSWREDIEVESLSEALAGIKAALRSAREMIPDVG